MYLSPPWRNVVDILHHGDLRRFNVLCHVNLRQHANGLAIEITFLGIEVGALATHEEFPLAKALP